jgi:hypothetical protein
MLQVQYTGEGSSWKSQEFRRDSMPREENAPILTSNIMKTNDVKWTENNGNEFCVIHERILELGWKSFSD